MFNDNWKEHPKDRICPHCEGECVLEIRNAYNPDMVEIITCDYCNGTGKVFSGRQKN